MIDREVYRRLPALARYRLLTRDRVVACEVDEDHGRIDAVQLLQEVEVRESVGVLVEALRPSPYRNGPSGTLWSRENALSILHRDFT